VARTEARFRIVAAATVLASLGLLAAAAPAGAARGLQTGFLDALYQSGDAATRQTWLDRSVQAGASLARVDIKWSSIAKARPANPTNPADPAYSFSLLDATVRDATARGLTLLLNVHSAPTWAEGPNRPTGAAPGTWRPGPAEFGQVATAIATRYGGSFPDPMGGGKLLPRVSFFQAWNEPNLSDYLTPQYEGRKSIGPLIYRGLLNAFYDAVKAVHSDNVVVTAGTAPYGDPPGGPRTRPVAFWRSVFCLKRKGKAKGKGKRKGRGGKLARARCPKGGRAKLDVLAHHPINTTGKPTNRAANPDDASSPDMGRIRRVLRAAERLRTIRPGGRRPLWATEMWWETNPPDTVLGVSPSRQARFVEQALFLIWKGGGSVALNLQVRDAPFNPSDPFLVNQSGIFDSNGAPKPSFTAFRFPLVAERLRRGAVRVWGKSPLAGALSIQRARGANYRTLRTLTVGAGQVFVARLRLRRNARLRAQIGGESSLVWVQK
jgi:hypothetical protein